MGSTFRVYAVPFGRLKRVPGSRDRALADAIAVEHADRFADVDDLADEEEDVPTCREALDRLVDGEIRADDPGYVYGYVLEAVCSHLGRELEGVSGISGASGWIDPVDTFLRSRGFPLELVGLVFGACPVEFPTPDDAPYIGSWPPEAIPAALESIRAVDESGEDFDVAETVGLIRRWLEAAAEEPDCGIVGVLS